MGPSSPAPGTGRHQDLTPCREEQATASGSIAAALATPSPGQRPPASDPAPSQAAQPRRGRGWGCHSPPPAAPATANLIGVAWPGRLHIPGHIPRWPC